jgi:hypothetical protein
MRFFFFTLDDFLIALDFLPIIVRPLRFRPFNMFGLGTSLLVLVIKRNKDLG